MWQPTHVQVTVQKARGVLIKGKNDTNDAFVVIAIGKEKFQTSIKERSSINVEWHEECDLEIPRHGNTASLSLTLYHRNSLGMDEFLGQVVLPLSDFDVYERPRTRSLKLQSKPDKAKKKPEKDRGELEVKIAFIVKSGEYLEPGKKEKHKSSLTSIKHLGGSLLSLGSKDKNGLKKFTKSVSNRMDKLVPKKKKNSSVSDDYIPPQLLSSRQWGTTADPGVISDEEDDLNFDDMKVAGGGVTANSSPYSITSRASSHRHKLQTLHDDESLNEMDYPAPQIVHHGPSSERETSLADLSTTTGDFDPHESLASERKHSVETVEDFKHSDGIISSPPSPEPFSLNINFANMTPVELPQLKTKPRKSFDSSPIAETAEIKAPDSPPSSNQSSVPSLNPPKPPPKTVHNLSRSSSQSSGFVESVTAVKQAEDSPASLRSGVSGSSSKQTFGSVSSFSREERGELRGGSVKERRQDDEWEKKLYGRRSTVGSLEALSHAHSSHSSLNNSCASSTHDLHPMDHSSLPRLPEVKALTLDKSAKLSPYEGSPDSTKKTKRKGFKSRLFSKSGGSGSRERVEEEYSHRVVEGGNDKLPNAPLSNPHSRLSQEIHNKFAGKSREDLMEQILSLQSALEGEVHHSRDLEEYIDNLLLRVLDASPHLLQAPLPTHPSSRSKNTYMKV